MPIDDREQQFERALARHLREAARACPDAEILAAYHERTLSLEEMAKWKEHIATCERCQEALALVEQTEAVDSEDWKEQDLVVPQKAAAKLTVLRASMEMREDMALAHAAPQSIEVLRPIRRPRANWKWIAPIGAIAAGVLVWVGSIELHKQNQPASQSVQIAQNRPAEEPPPVALQTPAPTTRTDQLGQKQEEVDKELRDESAARTVVPKMAAKLSAPMSAPKMNASGALPGLQERLDKKKDATGGGFGNEVGPAPTLKAPPTVVSSEMKAEGNDIVSVGQGASVSGGQLNAPMAGAKAAPAPAAPPPDRAHSVMAQKSTAGFVAGNLSAITGSVLDPSGAAISGAVITAIDTSNGSSRTVVADAAGKFQLSGLPSDTYRLIVAQSGFAKSEQMVALQPKQNEQLNIQLKLGSSSQTVEVTSTAAAINTSSAQVSSDAAVARKLPMNGRNYVALTQLAAANPQYIASPDQTAGWRVGDAGRIERTTDYGKTWKAQASGVSADLRTGSASSGKVCWVVGKAGTILLTTDGGKHWKQITSPISDDLGGVHAVDALHASIWDVPNRQSFETFDGGATWKRTANE